MPFRDVTGEDELDRLTGRVKETLGLPVGGGVIHVGILPGEGMLSSALSSHDDGVIGESMKGISTSNSSSQSNPESTIDRGMKGARSSKFSSSSCASFSLSALIFWSSLGEGMYGVLLSVVLLPGGDG